MRDIEFERGAWADLDDSDSWRVFADWLLSVGDARGEIVSLALHLPDAFASERKAMAARVRELERPFIDGWHEWAQDHDLLGVDVEFKRGFVHGIKGPFLQLRPVIDALFEREPIQRLTLTDVEPDTLAELGEREPPWFSRLRYLVGELGEAGAAALAAVPLTRLQRLNLLGTGLDDRGCAALAGLQTTRLAGLVLTANAIGDQGLAALLGAPTRGQWRELYLSDNPLGTAGLTQLARNPGLDALTHLYLREIDADFEVLCDPAALPGLTRLEQSLWQDRAMLVRLRARFGAGLISG